MNSSTATASVPPFFEFLWAIRRASVDLNHKSGNDRLVSKVLEVDIFSGKRIFAGVDTLRRGEGMTDPYIEDDGAEFPFNNCVRCGQTEYQSGFGEDPVQTGKIKATAPKGLKAKFLPRVANRARK